MKLLHRKSTWLDSRRATVMAASLLLLAAALRVLAQQPGAPGAPPADSSYLISETTVPEGAPDPATPAKKTSTQPAGSSHPTADNGDSSETAPVLAQVANGPVASGPVASGPVASGPVASGPVASGPAASTAGASVGAQPAQPSSAVRDVTNKRYSWWDDFLNRTSPFHLGLDVSETYDDNIFIQPYKTSDYITSITPGITAEFGNKTAPDSNYFFALAQYTALLYARHSSEDANDYFLDFHYQHQFTRLILGIEQQVRRETLTDIDVGARVQSNVYATVATADYAYNDDLSLRGTVTQNIVNYNSSYFNTDERVADFYALYRVLPKLSLGLGPRIGFVSVQGGPDQTYEDALFDLFYEVTDKTNITLVAGPEARQYQGADSTMITPVLDLTVNYEPWQDTTLKLEAHRRRIVSYGSRDEDYTNNEVLASVRQGLFQRVYVNFGGGYDLNDYIATGGGAATTQREDNYFFVRGGLEWETTDRLTVSATYQYSRDNSNIASSSFNDNQISVDARLNF